MDCYSYSQEIGTLNVNLNNKKCTNCYINITLDNIVILNNKKTYEKVICNLCKRCFLEQFRCFRT